MLVELTVTDLGPVAAITVVFGPGMTAMTGETGAGKTIVTEAIKLLCGGKADTVMVRSGAKEAVVEGRFVTDDDEVVVRRVVPASGRSRGYLQGQMASTAELAATVGELVDIHGQNGHQSLVRPQAQRSALDQFGNVDTQLLRDLRRQLAELDAQLTELGGDERARAREIELVRYQLDEIVGASIADADEDNRLRSREDLLADAGDYRDSARDAANRLGNDDGAGDIITRILHRLENATPFAHLVGRLKSLEVELADVANEFGGLADTLDDDPEELAKVQRRRTVLSELRRKYGATLGEVIDFRDETEKRLHELETHDVRAAELDILRGQCQDTVRAEEAVIGAARRAAAPKLATAIEAQIHQLALPHAVVKIQVGEDDPGDEVTILVAMNSGTPPAPLAKVASGGELARTMLALQLVLSDGPPLLIFDEVDAGVGGAAASAVGDALSDLGKRHQVLVVSHLAQVAGGADRHILISKRDDGSSVATEAQTLEGDDRVAEIARMLAGDAESATAQDHAREILAGNEKS